MALLCLLITSSCKKETPEPEKNIFSAKIEDTLVEFPYLIAVKSDFMASETGKMMRIVGKTQNRMIAINIHNYKGVGEYVLNDNMGQIAGSYSYTKKDQGVEKDEIYFLTEGSVKITSVTEDRIKGFFFFKATGYDEKTITEGQFSINITDDSKSQP
jgi:hypothetical protein